MPVLDDKTALITGSASGIGRAAALAFAREGASLLIADIDEAGGEAIAAEIRDGGGRARFQRTDISDPASCEAMVAAAIDAFGKLDIAVNNAAVADYDPAVLTADEPVATWQRTIELSLSSVFYSMRAELPVMVAAGGGSIVNTASIAGIITFAHCPAYVAAKHGVIGLTKTVCNEYADKGIRCNAVAPAQVETPAMAASAEADPEMAREMVSALPMGRFARPGEIAEAMLWLASPAASYVNGSCLVVDGGFTVR